MFCANCGSKMENGDKFCGQCGWHVEEEKDTQQAEGEKGAGNPNPKMMADPFSNPNPGIMADPLPAPHPGVAKSSGFSRFFQKVKTWSKIIGSSR